ncbi:hypothetical protein ACFX2J_015653 [Malus domestica]
MNSFPFSSSALKPHFLPLTNTNEEHDQGHTAHQRLHFPSKHHHRTTHSLHSAQDTQAIAFHCAVATATVHRLLLRDSKGISLWKN